MKRLTPKHPTHLAIEKVFTLMEQEGLRIEWGPYGEVTLYHHGYKVEMCDLERNPDSLGANISSIPPVMEYKLISRDDEIVDHTKCEKK